MADIHTDMLGRNLFKQSVLKYTIRTVTNFDSKRTVTVTLTVRSIWGPK